MTELVIENTCILAILQIQKGYHKPFQIVDYTMTNIQYFSFVKIVSFVPQFQQGLNSFQGTSANPHNFQALFRKQFGYSFAVFSASMFNFIVNVSFCISTSFGI
jgi:hypothetical protein